MLDVNALIADNIQKELKRKNRKQIELSDWLGVSKQTMSKIMNGTRTLSAVDLQKISEFLNVSMESLMKFPDQISDNNVIHTFMGCVKSDEAKRGIQIADELSDLIIFHSFIYENGIKMEEPWEESSE